MLPLVSSGAVTLPAGGGVAFDNHMPSLGMRYLVNVSNGNDVDLGEVAMFAPNTATPHGWEEAQGQLLQINDHPTLFSKLGTNFGGDGQLTFALPDMRGRTAIGAGQGPGLPGYPIGFQGGSEEAVMQLTPTHTHSAGGGYSTEAAGDFSSHQNLQPSLALTPIIATQGTYPSRSSFALATAPGDGPAQVGTGSNDPYVGELAWIAHDDIPTGWAIADGSELSISSNQSLFSLLGDMYGGDGRIRFALPDLRGRAPVAADGARRVGSISGVLDDTLTTAQMPAHTHPLPGGGETGSTGGSQPQSNEQPTLAITQLVALAGVFAPSPALATAEDTESQPPISELGHAAEPYLGSVTMFAGNFAPRGFAEAHGQTLPINSNTALFALLWDTYGGDARSNFDLPDLRERLAVGVGSGSGLTARSLGEEFGEAESVLTIANLPSHTHTFSIPGDYNDDGLVNAADYTVWRDNLGGAEGTLPNDPAGGTIGQAQYDIWAANYGQPAASGSPTEAIPEPNAGFLLALGAASMVFAAVGSRH